jgi:glycosyltransferase involved in cell wall biosynthesis
VVCDIDDTVLVTGIATPLRAAWRTFVQPMTRRQAVPGMARLLRELTAGAPHVPVVYLSNGPWNLAGPLGRFLERSGFPPGALLLTDWGPTPTRVFRDGRSHKRTSLERLAADLEVAERLFLPGRVPDVAAWLRRATVYVQPARWEGFGLGVLEAMHAGLPVVATNVSSLPELVVDGETGLLVPRDDAAALARGIATALGRPELGAAGRERARTEFSVERMASRTTALYERL